MKDTSPVLVVLQVMSVLGAGIFLFTSRFYAIALVPAVVLLGLAVVLACYSHYRLFSLLIIGLFATLILSLRFDYLTWGDPWFEYGMIQAIIAYHSLDPSVYSAQLPVMHVVIATISLFSGINPLDLLKYIIPPLSVIGLYAVYRFTKEISSSTKTALFAGLILLCGTPYLHWTAQGVRESIGIGLFALALYVSFTAIQSHKKQYLFLSLLLAGGLVLTHHLSSMIFLITWIAVSLTYLYLICDMNRIRTTGLFSLLIAVTAVVFMMVWWMGRLDYEYTEFTRLMNSTYHSDFGIVLFIVSLVALYLIPLAIPDKIVVLRSIVTRIFAWKNIIYAVFIAGAVVGSAVVLNFVLGRSGFVLNYPFPMFFNGICMILLALIGIYYFLEPGRLHFLAWIVILGLALVLSMSNIVPFVDPLRFLEFLYIPLAIIAAFGLTRIADLALLSKIFPFILAVFVVVSVVTSFPSVVFWGTAFEPGHPLFDTRSLVIQHQASEISAISWLGNSHATGVMETDSYVGYAAGGMISTNVLTIQSLYPFVRDGDYPQDLSQTSQQHYLLILSRFTEYMEFGAQWLGEKHTLDQENLTKIGRDCNELYDNGDAEIFSYSTQ
jgi:hypothetical protein